MRKKGAAMGSRDPERIACHVLAICGCALLSLCVPGCATAEKSFEQAREANTIEGYTRFLEEYGGSARALEAKRCRDELYWRATESIGTVDAYEKFLTEHPDSEFAVEAKKRAEDLLWGQKQAEDTISSYEQYLRQYPAGEYAASAKEQVERLCWQEAQDENTTSSYESYLLRYPNGRALADAERHIEELHFAKAQAANSVEACQSYLQKYPEGRYASEVHDMLPRCRYSDAAKTLGGLQDYVKEYPESPFLDEAKERMRDLTQTLTALMAKGDECTRRGEEWHAKAGQPLGFGTYSNAEPIEKEIECMQNALTAYRKAREIDPANSKILMRLGLAVTYHARQTNTVIVSSEKGSAIVAEYPPECLSLCDLAVELSPEDGEAYLYRSGVFFLLRINATRQEKATGRRGRSDEFNEKLIADIRKAVLLGYPSIDDTFRKIYNCSAMTLAISNPQLECVSLLLERGADIDEKEDGCTPLIRAVIKGNSEVVRTLLQAGADTSIKYLDKTALQIAKEKGNATIVELMQKY